MKTRFVLLILSSTLVACQSEESLGTLTENSESVARVVIGDRSKVEVELRQADIAYEVLTPEP